VTVSGAEQIAVARTAQTASAKMSTRLSRSWSTPMPRP
jgi:hypothetical protein